MDIAGLIADLDQHLAEADAALGEGYPGDREGRQPVHTVYVPADQFNAHTVHEYGRAAQASVISGAADFLEVIGGNEDLFERVLRKLDDEPVEDLRIDFEDGYGVRPDDEEDAAARSAAAALRQALVEGVASPFHGIRFKSLERDTRARGIRTLATFLEALGQIPDGFVVTLPKVTSVAQVEAMMLVADRLEPAPDTLRFEIQVETPQAVLGPDGTALVARMIHAAAGRLTGLHYGTYDYSASCGIAAAQQSLDHPAADHAKAVMQVAAAGTGVRLADGSTNRIPVGDTGGDPRGLGAPPPSGHQVARARVLPGLGPAPGAAAHPVRRDVRVLPQMATPRPDAGCATTSAARAPGSSTSPPPRGRSPGSCCAATSAARSPAASCARPPASTSPTSASTPDGTEAELGIVLGANQYGKAESRVVRIYRDTERHEIRDLNVSTAIRGDFADAHITGDQAAGAAHRHPEEHRVRVRQEVRRPLAGGVRRGARRAAARGHAGRDRGAGAGGGVPLGPGHGRGSTSTTTRSCAAAARCARSRST